MKIKSLCAALLISGSALADTANFSLAITGLPAGYTCNNVTAVGSAITIGCISTTTTPPIVTPPVVTPPISWNTTCPGFTETHLVTIKQGTIGRQIVNMGPNDAVVVEFTTGSRTTADTLGYPSLIGIADYASLPSGRIARLSSKPCDFSVQTAWGANADDINTTSFYYIVGAGNTYNGYYPLLQTNTKYYINFKNVPGTSCFATSICDVFVESSNQIPN